MQEFREEIKKKVEVAYKSNRAVLIEAATSTGKTALAINLIEEKQRWLIVIPKLVLIENWKDEFKKWGKEALLDNVEFCAYAGLEKFAETGVKRNVILDEAHHLNERRYLAVKDILNRGYVKAGPGTGKIIALSATVDEDRRPLLNGLGINIYNTVKVSLDAVVGANIVGDYKILVVHVPLSEEKSHHQLSKWKKFYGTETQAYELLTNEYNQKKETGGETKWAILNRLHFLYNLESKEKAAKLVLSQLSEDRRLLVFGSNIAQVDRLCEFTHHSKKGKKDTTFKDFCNGDFNRLGSVATLAEGVNIPNLDTGFVVQATSKSLKSVQKMGRLLRKDGKDHKEGLMIMLSAKDTQDAIWVNNTLASFDKSKVFHTDMEKVKEEGIETIINKLR